MIAAIRNVVIEDTRERLIKRHLVYTTPCSHPHRRSLISPTMCLKNTRQGGNFGIFAGLRSITGTTTMIGQVSHAEHYAQFQEMRKRQKMMKKSRAFAATGITICVFIVFWIGGAVVFAATEGWTVFQGFYFA